MKAYIEIVKEVLGRGAVKKNRTGIDIESNPIVIYDDEPEYHLCFGDIHCHDYLSPGLGTTIEADIGDLVTVVVGAVRTNALEFAVTVGLQYDGTGVVFLTAGADRVARQRLIVAVLAREELAAEFLTRRLADLRGPRRRGPRELAKMDRGRA